jgi:hypothetical protein
MFTPSSGLAQRQSSPVNVAIGDIIVQLPIAVADNICGVDVQVLPQQSGSSTMGQSPAGLRSFLFFAHRTGRV